MKPTGIKESWYKKLKPLFDSPILKEKHTKLLKLKYFSPKMSDIFRAFSFFEFDELKVVMLGLSPYETLVGNKRRATGLAFGVPDKSMDSYSLRVIRDALFDEECDITIDDYFDYTLESWAEQGVLLLNSALTVPINGNPLAHVSGWEWFIKPLIELLNENCSAMPFVFFGKEAQKYAKYVSESKNYIIKARHPAARSSTHTMVGQRIFGQVNEIIEKTNGAEFKIKWTNDTK